MFSFQPGVYDVTLNLIASIPFPSVLTFRILYKYKIYLKHCSIIHDSGQRYIDLETFYSSTNPRTMVHVQHVHFVIFEIFENYERRILFFFFFSQVVMSSHASNTRS